MDVARKLTLALTAGILLVHAVAAAYRVQRERELFEGKNVRDAEMLGRVLGHAVERTWVTHGEHQALSLVEHATEREAGLDIRWVWAGRPVGANAPAAPVEALEPLLSGEPVVTHIDDNAAVLYVYVPVDIEGYELGAIEIADQLEDEHRYVSSSLLNISLTTVILVSLCGGLTWLLGARLIGRPVRLLVAQARAIAGGDLGRRLRLPVRDEIGELAREIDVMCDGLEAAGKRVEAETQARIEAVDQLRHADRLKTVGMLASGIAHELGTPINVIEGNAALLREGPQTPEAADECVRVIKGQCKRMTAIIQQLLQFARREAPRGSNCDASYVARQTLDMVVSLAHSSDVHAVFEAEEARVAIAFDPLQQVLTNLLLNAFQAMPDGGELLLRVRRVMTRAPARDSVDRPYVAILVRDSGIGMDHETRDRVFEPFFTTKEVGEGTGLGLAVAYGIIDDHAGWISVDSRPGKGSSFTVYLPRDEAA